MSMSKKGRCKKNARGFLKSRKQNPSRSDGHRECSGNPAKAEDPEAMQNSLDSKVLRDIRYWGCRDWNQDRGVCRCEGRGLTRGLVDISTIGG
jgi:hypothetical protein